MTWLHRYHKKAYIINFYFFTFAFDPTRNNIAYLCFAI
jgi:hypothetical protein